MLSSAPRFEICTSRSNQMRTGTTFNKPRSPLNLTSTSVPMVIVFDLTLGVGWKMEGGLNSRSCTDAHLQHRRKWERTNGVAQPEHSVPRCESLDINDSNNVAHKWICLSECFRSINLNDEKLLTRSGSQNASRLSIENSLIDLALKMLQTHQSDRSKALESVHHGPQNGWRQSGP